MPTQSLPPRRSLTVLPPDTSLPRVLLVGNPNTGKTTLFNKLTGLRAKTANFPGTTIERREGRMPFGEKGLRLIDLPGLYGLDEGSPEEHVARLALEGADPSIGVPSLCILVLDATAIGRHLYLAGQVREIGVPCVAALNMTDLADADGIEIDETQLAAELGCPVVRTSARSGKGLDALRQQIQHLLQPGACCTDDLPEALRACGTCTGCRYTARFDWAEAAGTRIVKTETARLSAAATDRIDKVLTQPILGMLAFGLIMAAVFIAIFWAASYPMDLVDTAFAWLGEQVTAVLPAGVVTDFINEALIGGMGGVIIFLPQIIILFFALSLLEDTGYLARAAFVMDRWMQKVGLPGKAFVPMLSAHACAIPALMATRVLENRGDRLRTMMVIPLLTCSARLPVYAMVTALLFADRPVLGGLTFFACYALGILAAVVSAFVLRKTILPGKVEPLLIELPRYRLPLLGNAIRACIDRGWIFLKRAGTVILVITIILWALTKFPGAPEAALAAAPDENAAAEIQLEHSTLGRIGKFAEPAFRPLGFDWKITTGVMASFAAREVIVSTLGTIYAIGEDGVEDSALLTDTLRNQKRADGVTPVFTLATSLSLLTFFVLAMQCLPTQAVMRRESGSWKWAALQLVYMTVLAWSAGFSVYQITTWLS